MPILVKRRAERPTDGAKHLYEQASRFVYAVVARTGQSDEVVQGSAVGVSDRILITNCHVIRTADNIVLYSDNVQYPARRLLVGDSASDRCLLYAEKQLTAFATIREFADVRVGEKVFAIGAPQGMALGLSLTLSDGIVSGKRAEAKNRLIQTTASISPGSSGGGLFDTSGKLIGITTFTLSTGQNLNFAIAAEEWKGEVCRSSREFFWAPDDCR